MKRSDNILIAILVSVVILGVIGWLSSPVNGNGRPVLLLPDVKAVEDYRRQAGDWTDRLRLLDGQLATLLAGNSGDLLGQSRAAQNIFEDCLNLVREIDFTSTPPALVGLRESLVNASLANLEASRGALRWVSMPNIENRDQVEQLIQIARQGLQELETNTWTNP
jgi:hypothetical protein